MGLAGRQSKFGILLRHVHSLDILDLLSYLIKVLLVQTLSSCVGLAITLNIKASDLVDTLIYRTFSISLK